MSSSTFPNPPSAATPSTSVDLDLEADAKAFHADEAKEGVKFDAGKPRFDLLPPDALTELVMVLTFGANKYAARNWEKGMAYGRLIGAALRHIVAIMRGEDRDPETGLLHAAHAMCCLMFLCGYQLRGMTARDDRPDLTKRNDFD